MATIKSFTDLEQSKKLAEILPLESADMHYNNVSIKGINYVDEHRADLMEYNRAIEVLSKCTINPLFEVIPCWSLSALLNVLPYPSLAQHANGLWSLVAWVDKVEAYSVGDSVCGYDNEIDACVAMIEKLHELKML